MRMTQNMFVAITDSKLAEKYGDSGRILRVENGKEGDQLVPKKFILTGMGGEKFEAEPQQIGTYSG